jgi:hypothetical protein
MEHNTSGRRPHYHRGRRGADRRGSERRTPQQQADHGPRSSAEQVDVDQIMREIRSRVSQRHGIDLTPQQIQELAARRLEAILDPRNVSPTLFEQLRKSAASAPDAAPQPTDDEATITEDAIYEGSGAVRFFRRLLNPLLKLLFNPAPLIAALQAQARLNREAAARAAERERRQTEWNALHYQVLQRLVTEVSRNSLEVQALMSRVEALGARVDFNDRRVRTLENAPVPARHHRTHDTPQHSAPAAVEATAGESTPSQAPAAAAQSGPDGQRRRRRRRRGRRGTTPGVEVAGAAATGFVAPGLAPDDGLDDEDDEEMAGSVETAEPVPAGTQNASPPADSPPVSATVDLAAVSHETLPSTQIEPTASPDPGALTAAQQAPAWPVPGPAPTPVPEAPPALVPGPGNSEPQEPQ